MTRDLVTSLDGVDTSWLLSAWSWRLPPHDTPLFVGAFGDVAFGAPDGSLWLLDMLEGDYRRIARDSAEYNELKRDPEILERWFFADWVEIAERHGIVPGATECLGWKVHPMLGAPFEVENIGVFSTRMYHSLMGQLFEQAQGR